MDKRSADRIIVKSNARMEIVLDWFSKNREWLKKQEFHAPLDAGVVELQEELIEFTFESKGDLVELAVYPAEKPNLPAVVTYDYDPVTTQTSNFRFASHLPPERKMLLMQVMAMDNTHLKEALKYHALMCFMTYYRETVKIEDKGKRTKRQAKALRKDVTKPLPLIRKQYVIEEVDSKVLRLPDQKRTYTKPEHEVSVRGYMRHYKSGKSVWIEPFTKYRGKDKNRKDYEL